MDDVSQLLELNEQFIDACRKGSWDMLRPILSPSFGYIDGTTGEVWERQQYIDDIEGQPAPGLGIDQVAVHVDGDTAGVSARGLGRPAGRSPGSGDTYEGRAGGWRCVHAGVWPLA